MFTGKTINMGVIGNPISHSLSPAMQNAGIQAAGLDYAYIATRLCHEENARSLVIHGLEHVFLKIIIYLPFTALFLS